ncbi:CPBP family intramembrane metalloprotease [Piscinibacter sp. XHJ-5]|uniref:CPBP family intramembrane glutamic endopeptidase n=1 Tax=Piscinibacter sp. XHJ-5 TaxID=3037797 RepID=UPI002452C4B5|nr:CPBP family intramembrane metalloprotease [Piscinibacter sp. XHJ-5]
MEIATSHAVASFALLGPSICAVWLPAIRVASWRPVAPWVLLFAAAVMAGLWTGVLQGPGALCLVVLAALAWSARDAGNRWLRCFSILAVIVLAVALALHAVPGFKNPVVIDAARFSVDSAPFTQYANFDKGAVGLLLLALMAPHIGSMSDLRRMARPSLLAALVTVMAVLGAAAAIGYVRWDPKWPPQAWTFLAINLLFTCVAEEAVFRGVIQEQLIQALEHQPRLVGLPVVVSTLLFALIHVNGGLPLVALAALAGLGYSLVYAMTRRVEAAILVHFAVNAVHFVGFSYPCRVG